MVRRCKRDRVKWLRRWLKRAKARLAYRDGCAACGNTEVGELVFKWETGAAGVTPFPIGRGVLQKGMTLDRLELDPQTINDTLGTLLKYQDDIAKIQGSEAARLLAVVKAELARVE